MSELQRAPKQLALDAEAEREQCGIEQRPLDDVPHVQVHAGVATVGAAATGELPPGWWIWTSVNEVDHAVAPDGKCSTCGRSHDRSIDAQVTWLYDVQRAAERETIAEQGADVVERGGWIEIALAVLEIAPAWITDAAKREYLRTNGIER